VLAFLPRGAGPWPTLELRVGGRWRDDDVLQRELQRLAQRRSVAIVVTGQPLDAAGWSVLRARHSLTGRRVTLDVDVDVEGNVDVNALAAASP
jgi:hypothetical protein